MGLNGTKCVVYLYTRNHEFITLGRASVPNVNTWITSESQRLSRIYGLKIISIKTTSGSFLEQHKKFNYEAPLLEQCYCRRGTDGTIYILDPYNKMGYSLHGDYLLDTYAIKKFVHVPSSDNISFNELSQYTLIAL